MRILRALAAMIFLPTSPVWGTTCPEKQHDLEGGISTHVPRMGDDCSTPSSALAATHFYPRPPYGGRPREQKHRTPPTNFYPRPPYGGRPQPPRRQHRRRGDFYPRPPYGGRHSMDAGRAVSSFEFLPTSPVWGTTAPAPRPAPAWRYFYPRPPYGGRHTDADRCAWRGRDFYPRPPYGGRQPHPASPPIVSRISTHVPRMGDDRLLDERLYSSPHFYPRPPYGGRRPRKSPAWPP